MESTTINDELFDEKQSLKIIKTAISSSKRILMDDGILLICWGLAFSISNFWKYYESIVLTSRWFQNIMDVIQIGLGIAAISFTVYYLFFRKRKVTTYSAISTRFVWIG